MDDEIGGGLPRKFRYLTWCCVAVFLVTAGLALIAPAGDEGTQILVGFTGFLLFLYVALPLHVAGLAAVVFLAARHRASGRILLPGLYFVAYFTLHAFVFMPVIKPFVLETADVLVYSVTSGAEKELIEQVRRGGDIAAVRELIADGVDVNAVDRRMQVPAVAWAAANADIEIVELLLQAGADPNAARSIKASYLPNNLVTGASFAPLPRAASVRDAAERRARVRLLLDHGARPDGGTAFLVGCAHGDLEVMRLLVDRGAPPDAVDVKGKTCAHVAARQDHVDVLRFLADRGVALDARTRYTLTPLDAAIAGWSDRAILYLLRQGYRPNRPDGLQRYLHKAPATTEKEQIRTLVEG